MPKLHVELIYPWSYQEDGSSSVPSSRHSMSLQVGEETGFQEPGNNRCTI